MSRIKRDGGPAKGITTDPVKINLVGAGKERGRTKIVRFGSVEIRSPSPDAERVRLNVQRGSDALSRAKVVLTKSGVKLALPKRVAKYRADPDNPTILVREIDGRIDRGRFVNGRFEPAE